MPVAVNGNVNGAQLWIADHHWWDYPETWKLPRRPEDGQLDWERLFPHQRDVIRRFSATLRRISGLPEALPQVPYQPFGTPSPQGWVMPISSNMPSELRYGICTSGGSIVSHHPIVGTDTFALLVSSVGDNPWFVIRADGHPWHANPWAKNTRVGSVWVRVLAWEHSSRDILPFTGITVPPRTVPAQLRTIYVDRYPDDPDLYGSLTQLPTPAEERIEVRDVPVWWKEPPYLWWKHFLQPEPGNPDSYWYGPNSLDERKAYQCIVQYAHLLRKWTSPYVPTPDFIARFDWKPQEES